MTLICDWEGSNKRQMLVNWPYFILGALLIGLGFLLFYWLVIVTEGIYMGRRVVVWLYDMTAAKYEGTKKFDAYAEHHFLALPILSRIDDWPVPWVLDVATGTGRLARALIDADAFTGHVIGLDAARKMLLSGKALLEGESQVELLQAFAAPLPFADGQFAVVSCLEALEFFPDPAAALTEMARVLCPDGLLVVTRRKGWEARTFLGRYDSTTAFVARLQALGFVNVQPMPWQIDYDIVFAVKPIL